MKRTLFTGLLGLIGFAVLGGASAESELRDPIPLPRSEISGQSVHRHHIPFRGAGQALAFVKSYPGPQDRVQWYLRLLPSDPANFSFEQLALAVEDADTLLPIPTRKGWAPLPAAFAVDAAKARFVVNRPKGSVSLEYWIAIAPRADDRYPVDGLREACAQAVAMFKAQGWLQALQARDLQCADVTFLPLDDALTVTGHDANGAPVHLEVRRTARGPAVVVPLEEQVHEVTVTPSGGSYVIVVRQEDS